jgi:hypothetical protein
LKSTHPIEGNAKSGRHSLLLLGPAALIWVLSQGVSARTPDPPAKPELDHPSDSAILSEARI